MEEKIQVLLIEDNPGDARLVELLLMESDLLNAEIINKTSLSDGLEYLAQNNKTSIILLDLTLPDSRGFETLEIVLDKFPEKNIIVLTGLSDRKLGLKSVKAGARDYLIKGAFDADLLAKTIRHAHDRHSVIEESKKTISAKDIQINLIADITNAIKKDLPLIELLNVYKSSLQWIEISNELIFFLYEDEEWFELIRYPENSKSKINTSILSDFITRYTKATYIIDNDKERIFNFDFIIPVKQKEVIYGAVFFKEMNEAFEEKKKFAFLLTDIIGLAIINKEFENLRKRKEKLKTGILNLKELLDLQTVFLQYLNSIPDYIEGTKGKLVDFVFKRHPRGIEWEIELNSETSLEEIKEYLAEYLSYIFDKELELKNNITRPKVLETEISILELKHKQQLSHVENQVRIYEVENNVLKENVEYFKKLLSSVVNSESSNNELSMSTDMLKKNIAKGYIKEVIEELSESNQFSRYFDELIILKENYLSLAKKRRLGIITDESESILKNKIQNSLLEIINLK